MMDYNSVNTILQVKSEKQSNAEYHRFHFNPEVDGFSSFFFLFCLTSIYNSFFIYINSNIN